MKRKLQVLLHHGAVMVPPPLDVVAFSRLDCLGMHFMLVTYRFSRVRISHQFSRREPSLGKMTSLGSMGHAIHRTGTKCYPREALVSFLQQVSEMS